MLAATNDDLVTGAQADAGEDDIDPFGGVLLDRDFIAAGDDEGR